MRNWWEARKAFKVAQTKQKAIFSSFNTMRKLEVEVAELDGEMRYLTSTGNGRMGLGGNLAKAKCRLAQEKERYERLTSSEESPSQTEHK